MTEAGPADPEREPPRLSAEPTVRVSRLPAPDRGRRAAGGAAGTPPRPADPVHPDEQPTLGLPDPAPRRPHGTIRFGTPAPVVVTVTARPRRRRRYRTWPWIAAVVLALVVLAVVLLVLSLRGATVGGDVDLVGTGPAGPATSVPGWATDSG